MVFLQHCFRSEQHCFLLEQTVLNILQTFQTDWVESSNKFSVFIQKYCSVYYPIFCQNPFVASRKLPWPLLIGRCMEVSVVTWIGWDWSYSWCKSKGRRRYPADSPSDQVISRLGFGQSSGQWCCGHHAPAHMCQRGTGIAFWIQAVWWSWCCMGCRSARWSSFGGKALIIITTYLLNSMTIQIIIQLYGRPPCITLIWSLITYIWRSISGTWSLAAVMLMSVLVIILSKQLNSGYIYIVRIENLVFKRRLIFHKRIYPTPSPSGSGCIVLWWTSASCSWLQVK